MGLDLVGPMEAFACAQVNLPKGGREACYRVTIAALEEKTFRSEFGLASLAACGTTLPQKVMERIPQVDGVILGPVSHNDYPPVAKGGLNPSGEMRKRLEVAVGPVEHILQPRHQNGRRIVGDEMTREFGRDEFCG